MRNPLSKDATPSPRASRRLIWLLLLAGLVILLIWLGLKSWRVYRAAQSLLERPPAVQALLADGVGDMDPMAAEELVYGVRGDVVVLRDELGFLMPILPVLGWLPRVGPLLAAAPDLMEMADAGTEGAAYAYRGMQPALIALKDNTATDRISMLVQTLAQAEPDLHQASRAMDRVVAARARLGDATALPWRIQQLLVQADPWLPRAQNALKLALVAPDMLGMSGPRSYVILAQNEDELRATGGFISGAGLLTVDNGRIVNLAFKDASLINDVTAQPYDEYPPDPLRYYMLLDYFLLRDSNYWPDFPTSAQKALELYSYGEGVPPPDGVIAINQRFIQSLVEATGPVYISETDESISSDNVITSLQNAWTLAEGVQERKSFLSIFADAIRSQVEDKPYTVNPPLFVQNLFTAAESKDLQVYVTDPAVAAVLDEIGWNGRVPPPENNDSFMVVDTSLSYNKANLFIERSVDYAVDLSGAAPQASLTVTHSHTGTPDDEPCFQGSRDVYEEGGGYLALADKCYWNYLRVYVPAGSELTSGTEHSVPGDSWFSGIDLTSTTEVYDELSGYTTFANYMLVEKGQQVTTNYGYTLPTGVVQTANGRFLYRLVVFNQAGTGSQPLTITVTLPEGAELLSAQPEPTAVTGSTIAFDLMQATRETIVLEFRQGRDG